MTGVEAKNSNIGVALEWSQISTRMTTIWTPKKVRSDIRNAIPARNVLVIGPSW